LERSNGAKVTMQSRLKVGVVGCGLIAQVMHLHYLRELSEQFEIAALCDVSSEPRDQCARDYQIGFTCADWRDLLDRKLDALLILTSGSHAPIAVAALEAGLHLLVEKPMCFSVAEGHAMIAAARRAQRVLMVAYNKRYDPAFVRFAADAHRMEDLRLVRVTTLEAPFLPYVAHYRLHKAAALPNAIQTAFAQDNTKRIAAAIGDVDPLSARAYHLVLLDSLVHEFNVVRGILGEPDRLEFADVNDNCLTAVLRFGPTQCVLNWVDLPGIARYAMEFAFFAPASRLTLGFPSPFLRSAPTILIREGGEIGTARSWQTEEITSYEESFRQELIHFHECVTTGQVPMTSAEDALHDVALCQSVIDAHRRRSFRARPTDLTVR
jgi:predicted dehydrogenase